MTARIIAALFVAVLTLTDVHADVTIRVLDANGAVKDVEVTVEPNQPNGTIIDKGVTNGKGDYLSNEIPKNHGKLLISARPPLKSGLIGETIEATPKEGEVITIRLRKKL